MAIKSFIRKKTPNILKRKFRLLILFVSNRAEYKNYKSYLPKRLKLGSRNPGLTFYVLRKGPTGVGVLSCYLSFLGQLKMIEKKGYLPIVDMYSEYYNIIHNDSSEVNSINAWEKFFEKSINYEISEIFESQNVIFGYKGTPRESIEFFDETVVNKKMLQKWYNLSNNYFRLKEELFNEFELEAKNILFEKRVIGVSIREEYAGYFYNHPNLIKGHPKQPSLNIVINDLKEKLNEWNCKYIFLSTDSINTINKFREQFGSKVLFTNRNRGSMNYENPGEYVHEFKNHIKSMTPYQRNKDYLKEMYILSKCTSIIAGKSSGTIVSAIWNDGKYENIYFYNLGLY